VTTPTSYAIVDGYIGYTWRYPNSNSLYPRLQQQPSSGGANCRQPGESVSRFCYRVYRHIVMGKRDRKK
jgi:hypothetical protein